MVSVINTKVTEGRKLYDINSFRVLFNKLQRFSMVFFKHLNPPCRIAYSK